MTLSEPRALADFFDRLHIESFEWSVKENREIEGQGSGQILQSELAPDLWQATITIRPDYLLPSRQVRAMLNSLAPIGRTALIYDLLAAYPTYDPTGSIIGSSTVAITAIGANRDTLAFSGFPALYVLTPGDKIELQYGSSPVRRQLLEFSETKTANGFGVLSAISVYPNVRAAVTTAATVNLKKPSLKMLRISHNAGRSGAVIHDGMSISFIEKVV